MSLPICAVGDLIERTSQRERALLTLHVMTEMHFFTSEKPRNIMRGNVKMYHVMR